MLDWKDIAIEDPRFPDETNAYFITGAFSRKNMQVTVQLEVLDTEVNLFVDTIHPENIQKLYFENENFRENHEYLELFSCYDVDKSRKWKKLARKHLDKQTIVEIERFIKTHDAVSI